MTMALKYIKKLMGWCPNVRAHEARQHINLENFESDIPDRAGGENGDLKNPGWLRKASTRTLLVYTFFTIISLLVFYQTGIKMTFLLAGSFISLSVTILYWKTQMQRYDNLIKQPVTEYSNKRKITTFATVLVVYFVLSYIKANGGVLAVQAMISFIGGFLVSMWLEYLQILYWEKKNRKVIYIDKGYGWKKSYIILERK
ncbi:MAG: DUF1673 domain-containing protein [Methanosarcina sp.]|nr:DUF1673 domain-containing protein [Methanosarcina sp.]MDD3873098.1 DUF1673 domain-containing protein [Methanosarcina sp.]MDD4521650.1 DUF1673 domain-containing protein [Methanosarcina sp.]